MPSYKGTRVDGVSLLVVVPGTVDIQPRVGEVSLVPRPPKEPGYEATVRYARTVTKHAHTHACTRFKLVASYCLLIAKKLPSNA